MHVSQPLDKAPEVDAEAGNLKQTPIRHNAFAKKAQKPPAMLKHTIAVETAEACKKSGA